MKVADVKLYWLKSPSQDVNRVEIETSIDGNVTKTEVGPEVEEITVVVQARASVQFKVTVFDTEGNQASSEIHSFTLGDLEDPLPATALGHEILGVREVEEE